MLPEKTAIGIVGSGFIATGLARLLNSSEDLGVAKVLTRRPLSEVRDGSLDQSHVTNSVAELIDCSDLVVECSGDPIHGTNVLAKVLKAGLPVVTMNSELQVTTGSWLSKKGLLTEAEGDQPGCLAALKKEAISMGFDPLVYGNIKGFLNHTPTKEEMIYWAGKSGISLDQVTSFTDGTKIQIEQALVANGLGANIVKPGLIGTVCDDYQQGAKELAQAAESLGSPISDYVLSPKSPAGVFLVAKHADDQAAHLRYYKLGEGPYYVLTRPFHLCHLEIPKTIRQVLQKSEVLLDNSTNPGISVATIAKKELCIGEKIKRGVGSFEVRGEAIPITDAPNHLPIGLMFDAVIKRNIQPGQMLTFDDVEIPGSLALEAWTQIVNNKN